MAEGECLHPLVLKEDIMTRDWEVRLVKCSQAGKALGCCFG